MQVVARVYLRYQYVTIVVAGEQHGSAAGPHQAPRLRQHCRVQRSIRLHAAVHLAKRQVAHQHVHSTVTQRRPRAVAVEEVHSIRDASACQIHRSVR